jgi:L-ascorbate metabolism protein UlaG (beta-lactamase superfamily)
MHLKQAHILSKQWGDPRIVFFAGDTGLTDEFSEIGKKFDTDLAVLPIGDYHPYLWFIPGFSKMTRKRHMAPHDIPKAIEMLQAQMVIPIHWGTFKISGTGLNEPVKWMKKIIHERKLDDKVFILNHGETKIF